MAPEADPYERAVNLMEDALAILDALGASNAGALLDHAICEVPTIDGVIRHRRASNVPPDLSAFDQAPGAEAR